MTIWEILRLSILIIGWPTFIIGSIFAFSKIHSTYKELKRGEFSKLASITLSGWIITTFSLGAVSTAYMVSNPKDGVIVIIPVFFLWFMTMIMLLKAIFKLTIEVKEISAVYEKLETITKEKEEQLKIIEQKKKELSEVNSKLDETVKIIEKLSNPKFGQNKEMTEFKEKIKNLKEK